MLFLCSSSIIVYIIINNELILILTGPFLNYDDDGDDSICLDTYVYTLLDTDHIQPVWLN